MARRLRNGIGWHRHRQPQSCILITTYEKDALSNVANKNKAVKQDALIKHRTFFNQFVQEASVPFKKSELSTVFKRFEKCCFYNGTDRELYPSLIMMKTYEAFEESNKLTYEDFKLMSMLAWSFETVITGFIIKDDIMDKQKKRWKQLCWHNQPNIGLSAIGDSDLLKLSGFYMLKKYFNNHPLYTLLWNLLSQLITATALGQIMDLDATKAIKQKRFESITMDWYITTSRYKSLIPIITYPLKAAMYLTNSIDEYNQIKNILKKLGPYPQISNDVHDCFGNYESLGKTSDDISVGKFSWLFVKTLQFGNEKQKRLLIDNYAKPELEYQEIVKTVYKELDLIAKYLDYKRKLLTDVNIDVERMTNSNVNNLLQAFVDACVDVNDDISY